LLIKLQGAEIMGDITKKIELSYDEFLAEVKKAKKFHGHICGGIFTGIKVALAAKKILNIKKYPDRDLIVITEIDRCLTDAVMSVTGCRLGRKTLKFNDYGKFGATFCSLADGRAVRIAVRPDAMDRIQKEIEKKNIDEHDKESYGLAVFCLPVKQHFIITKTEVNFSEYDLPGRPKVIKPCSMCGENIFDGRHETKNGLSYCRPCLNGAKR